jgi:hypothetical protein
MRKNLRRVLERLRAVTDVRFGKRASVRRGLQEPRRMQALLVPARSGSRG